MNQFINKTMRSVCCPSVLQTPIPVLETATLPQPTGRCFLNVQKEETYQSPIVSFMRKHRNGGQWWQSVSRHSTIDRRCCTTQFVSKSRCVLRAVYSILQPLLIVQLRNSSCLKQNSDPMILKGKAYSRMTTSQFFCDVSHTFRGKLRCQPCLVLQGRKHRHTWPHHSTFCRWASWRITSSRTAAWLNPFFAASATSRRLASGVRWKAWKTDFRCRSGVFMGAIIMHYTIECNAVLSTGGLS